MASSKCKRVGIFVFDDVEVLDFCGPFEVFSASGYFDVFTIGIDDVIEADGGLTIKTDFSIEDSPYPDILVVPGGSGTKSLQNDKTFLKWLKRCSEEVELIATVCTGSILAAAAGLLEGMQATTHWSGIRNLEQFEGVRPNWDSRIVDSGKIITSAGISAGIDMALYVLESRYDKSLLKRAINIMEYDAYPNLKPNFKRPTFVEINNQD